MEIPTLGAYPANINCPVLVIADWLINNSGANPLILNSPRAGVIFLLSLTAIVGANPSMVNSPNPIWIFFASPTVIICTKPSITSCPKSGDTFFKSLANTVGL